MSKLLENAHARLGKADLATLARALQRLEAYDANAKAIAPFIARLRKMAGAVETLVRASDIADRLLTPDERDALIEWSKGAPHQHWAGVLQAAAERLRSLQR